MTDFCPFLFSLFISPLLDNEKSFPILLRVIISPSRHRFPMSGVMGRLAAQSLHQVKSSPIPAREPENMWKFNTSVCLETHQHQELSLQV